MNEQKTFKVRIKVVSDNLSAKKSTSIYSGLGLVSPSSSFGDSPTGSEGLYQRFQFPGDESPTQIIRMMTSFPRSHLLSPLPEGLVRLTEKLLQGHKAQPVFRHRQDNSVLSSNLKTDKTLPVEDTLKPEETDQLSPKDEDSVKALDDFHVIMSHQTDLNNEACEVLISEALKLPLLFDLHGPSQGKRGTSKQKSNLLPTVVSGGTVIPSLRCDSNWNEKQIDNKNLAEEVANEKKVDLQTDFRSYPKKDGDSRGEAANSSSKTNENDFVSKSKEDSNSRPSSSQKQKNRRKYANVEQEGKKLISGSEQLPSSGKKKHKRSHFVGTEATEIQNKSIRNAVSGNKASCTVAGAFPKLEGIIKAKDKDECLLGNLIEEGDDLMDSPDEPSNDRLNTSQICNQCLLPCDNDSRKRSDNGAHEHLISKVNSKRALDFAAPFGLVPPIGDPASAGVPVEDWVQCDKCLKWRLLPFAKVDSLPEKWLCGMLNWLPGMNSCNITEEETTKAAAESFINLKIEMVYMALWLLSFLE